MTALIAIIQYDEALRTLDIFAASQVPWMLLAVGLLMGAGWLGWRFVKAVEKLPDAIHEMRGDLADLRQDVNRLPESLALRLYQNGFRSKP